MTQIKKNPVDRWALMSRTHDEQGKLKTIKTGPTDKGTALAAMAKFRELVPKDRHWIQEMGDEEIDSIKP